MKKDLIMELSRLRKLSGLNEGPYADEAMQNLDRIASQILHLPDEILNHATNLDSEQEMNEVIEYFIRQLEQAIAKLRK